MVERIPLRYTVALQGFSDFEHTALVSFFRLGQQRVPSFQPATSPVDSDFVVVNGDNPAEVQALAAAGRLRDTIVIGHQAPQHAAACLARPIAPTRILRELENLLEQRLALVDEPLPTDWATDALDTRPDIDLSEPADTLADQLELAERDVLVLDDSRIALKFLQTRLQSLGYRVHATQDTTQAMTLLDSQPFALLFVDLDLGEGPLDGLAICQHVKQRARHPGNLPPKVVIVTGSQSASDRVRGTLAGCDAYLTKPLMEAAFADTLQRLGSD